MSGLQIITAVGVGFMLFGLVLIFLNWLGEHANSNLDLYPPPAPPKPKPAPPIKFVPVQPLPRLEDAPAVKNLPPPPEAGRMIFAPWVTEEEKQRILNNWRNQR